MNRFALVLSLFLGNIAQAQVRMTDIDASISKGVNYLNNLPDAEFESYNLRLLFLHLHDMDPERIAPRSGLLDLVPEMEEDIVIRNFYQGIVNQPNLQGHDSLVSKLSGLNGLDRLLIWGSNAHQLPLDSLTLNGFRSYSKRERDVRGVAHASLAYHWACFTSDRKWDEQLTPIVNGYATELLNGVVENGVVSDNALEGMVGLLCINQKQEITMSWLNQIMAAQNADGGWRWELSGPRKSNPHTTLLAIWILASVDRF